MRPTDLPRVLHLSDFDPPEDEFSTTLESFFSSQRPMFSIGERLWSPPTDVYETSKAIFIRVEIAGVRDEDLEIAVDRKRLRIRGRRSEPNLPKGQEAVFHLMEVRHGSFERVFGLPQQIDVDRVSATYRDGFLLIEIPKAKRGRGGVAIEIE
ncbi:Hsp20/alpha crystallin family protein [Candidatus Sumerlaeota bacterium]|nr:Hsp20/alpha crystallin family protein [Candidatus Sumerlaeota bacterium]